MGVLRAIAFYAFAMRFPKAGWLLSCLLATLSWVLKPGLACLSGGGAGGGCGIFREEFGYAYQWRMVESVYIKVCV